MKTKKMIIATATLLAAVGMGSGALITQAGLGVDQASAKTVRHIATPKSYKKLAKKAVHVSKGNLYSSAKLSKITHKAKNYKHTTFYRTKQAKVVKANKKTAVYNYIKSSNGKTKGWIWHGYVKNGKAPKAKAKTSSKRNAQGLKTGTSSKAAVKKNTPDGYTLSNGKNIPGTNIKLKSNKIYTDGYDSFYAIMKNGHLVYFKSDKPGKTTYRQYATEVIPGLKDPNTNFTNNTGHWVMYSVSGNGVKETDSHGDKDGWSDNGRIAAPIKGYKYASNLYDSIDGHFPQFGVINFDSGSNSSVYNWNKKIIVNTPAVNHYDSDN